MCLSVSDTSYSQTHRETSMDNSDAIWFALAVVSGLGYVIVTYVNDINDKGK